MAGYNYREATIDDAVKMLPLMHSVYLESDYTRIPIDAEYCVANAMNHINAPDKVIVIAEIGKEIVGILAGSITGAFINTDYKLASNTVFIIDKKHRGGYTAARMIKLYERWAKDHGADEIGLSVSSGIRTDRTIKLFNRMGYDDHTTTTRKYHGI